MTTDKPYLVLIPKPTTHENDRIVFKANKEAVIYCESLEQAYKFIKIESLFDPSLSFKLLPATANNTQKYLGE